LDGNNVIELDSYNAGAMFPWQSGVFFTTNDEGASTATVNYKDFGDDGTA